MSLVSSLAQELAKHKWKLIDMVKIKSYVALLVWHYSDQKVYKTIYALKNKGYLVWLKKDLFLVKDPASFVTETELIDRFYRDVLQKHCTLYIWWKRYIGWVKALELHISNFSCPDEIVIISEHKQSTEVLFFDKKVLCKKYTARGSSLFKKMFYYTKSFKIAAHSFRIATLELAILECLYSPNVLSRWYTNDIIKRVVKKYKGALDLSVLESILLLWKHHSSINRLYDIAKIGDKGLAAQLLILMKKHSYLLNL